MRVVAARCGGLMGQMAGTAPGHYGWGVQIERLYVKKPLVGPGGGFGKDMSMIIRQREGGI